ncbi:MAG: S9 family peptidase [Chitinophagaceae bacterium]
MEKWPERLKTKPPAVEKIPKELTIHGDTRIDNYYWLREKENPKTLEYLKAENDYLDAVMAGTKQLQEQLFLEMKGRIKEKDESVPVFKNGYNYYTRSEEGKQYYKYCRKKQLPDAPEEILLDVDEMGEKHAYLSVNGFNISLDNRLLAFGMDTTGRRQYTIHIKNLETGELFTDKIFPTLGSSVWANDNKTLFYAETNPVTLLSEKIKKHRLGDDSNNDLLVYEEMDKSNYIGVSKTRSRKYILITSSATLSTEIRIIDADNPDTPYRIFQPRVKDMLYEVEHSGHSFIVLTNWHAKNFRLMETALDNTSRENWKEKIAHRSDVLLQDAEPFNNHLVITERSQGLLHIRINNAQNDNEHYLEFNEPAYTALMGANLEFNTTNLRFHYTSLTTPASTYDYNMDTREKVLLKQQEVVGGYDIKEYITERLFATAIDETRIPISIVYKAGFQKHGTAPLLLYGYGSYGMSMDASFSSARLSLLNRGFAFAIAHVRGGQEMGRAWYEDGKLMKKKNSFTDFIDCAEYLLLEQYTSREHLYAMGGSAGGLLMGAVATIRPDLWHGIIAAVPFVDVITTMLDESIPLTTNEFDEWGNPKNKEAYDYMKTYSPYDNIRQNYPNMLVTTGLNDSQVQYFEPAKWVAAMRAHKSDSNVLLFHINMEAGHGGASGRFDYLKEVAREYAFLLELEGLASFRH